jgi:hypothetical protein
MALIKGALASFSDPLLGAVPTIVTFQYNPGTVTRVFRLQPKGGTAEGTGSALNASDNAVEEYTLTLELDATDGLERGGPLTTAYGVSPRLAALEMLMQPVGKSVLGGLVGSVLGTGSQSIPAGKLPLVLFLWGPSRITPVKLTSLTIRETSFDELLHPIHASADLGFTVLRPTDVPESERLAHAAAVYYQGTREAKAVLQLAQIAELT